jgi:hypothetical protein
MTDIPRRYADDPDANVVYPITDANDEPIDWATPTVKAIMRGVEVEVEGEWLGDAAATRSLKVPLDELEVGIHSLRLVVPDENDVPLGRVAVIA